MRDSSPKRIIAVYTLIQAKSREEAIEWTKRFPNPGVYGKQVEIEVRQLFELEDFEPGEAIERFSRAGRRDEAIERREGYGICRFRRTSFD